MVFYIALGFASVIAAVIILWLLRATFAAGKAAYRAILPSARHNQRRRRLDHLNSELRDTPNPWGWHGTDGARHASLWRSSQGANREVIGAGFEKSSAVSGLPGQAGSSAAQQVGWPYRPEPRATGATASGKTRRNRSGSKKLKPWGW